MLGKAALALGLGVGYVLGTRDGRERYEQIKAQTNRMWGDPRVQDTAAQAQDLAKQKAPQIQEKVADAARKAGSKAGRDRGGEAEPTSSPTSTASAPSATGSDL